MPSVQFCKGKKMNTQTKKVIKITKELVKMGYKQKDIAKFLQVSQSTISVWVRKPIAH